VSKFDTLNRYINAEKFCEIYNQDCDVFEEEMRLRLIAELRGEPTPLTPAMEIGTHLHNLALEPKNAPAANYVLAENFFSLFRQELPEFLVPETPLPLKRCRMFDISGRCDYITPERIGELKFTSYYSYNNYYFSLQWVFYLAMSKMDEFKYHIFLIDIKEESESTLVSLKDYHSFSFYRSDIVYDKYYYYIEEMERFLIENEHEINFSS
jgi:hypothetical protein